MLLDAIGGLLRPRLPESANYRWLASAVLPTITANRMSHAEQPATKQADGHHCATHGDTAGGSTPLSEQLSQSARMVAQREQLSTAFGQAQIAAGPVIQAKWKNLNDTVVVWDRPLGGLRWYFDTETELMSFEVVTQPEDEDLIAHINRLRDEEHSYHDWLDIWAQLGWIEQGGENDLSFFNEEAGQVEWWQEPDFPLRWEWWDEKALYRAELEPRPLPGYRQQWPNSCGIEGMRMVVEGLTGVPVDRADLIDYLTERISVLSEIKRSGIPFHNLPMVFDEYFGMRVAKEIAKDTEALARFLTGRQTVMLEVAEHVIVVDSVTGEPGQRVFAIRDPAHGDIEQVGQDDARLHGTGRILVIPRG